ncbi:MAG: hypothetical protein KC457_25520, partial [Myxococcales bacterium]|nr:hypothetical protein [Myxococcales bacterium]
MIRPLRTLSGSLVLLLAACPEPEPEPDPWSTTVCNEAATMENEASEQGLALFHVGSGGMQGLWWMDLSAADPLATATELLPGSWYPPSGHSDGRYALARMVTNDKTVEGALLDLRALPPTVVDPGLPAGFALLDGEVVPDGSALILRARDEVLDTQRLWRVDLDALGELGEPVLLTTEEPDL